MNLEPKAFNLIVEIDVAKKDELIKVLAAVQDNLNDNNILSFKPLKSIHFARLFILDKTTGRADYPDQLIFSTNYNGELDDHLLEIIRCPGADVDKIFNCCKGYTSNDDHARLGWLKENGKLRAYFYASCWGRSTEQILYEESSRKTAENKIDSLSDNKLSAGELRKHIIKNAGEKNYFNPFDEIKLPKINIWQVLKLIPLIILIIPILPLFLVILLIHEFSDDSKQFKKKYSNQERTQKFAKTEDKIVQNQLTNLTEIKPGLFRLATLKFVLSAIAYLAHFLYNKGKLGEIPTIHFARWIIIDNGKRLLFVSNYDGSWESYLGDFVDKASIGLTGIWSNTIGFPKTRLLLFKGARDEQRFKSFTRDRQVATNVWYSAYPDLTVTNITNNTALQKGLTDDLTDEEIDDWLLKY